MNPPQSIPGTLTPSGGNLFPLTPIWYPPVATKWIITVLIVFAGAVSNRVSYSIRGIFTNPIGFFVTAVIAIVVFKSGFPPGAFALLYLLLMMWATQISSKEGFLNVSNVDCVTNSKRWYVENVLNERPIGIQEKDATTFPVQGASAQGNTTGSS